VANIRRAVPKEILPRGRAIVESRNDAVEDPESSKKRCLKPGGNFFSRGNPLKAQRER